MFWGEILHALEIQFDRCIGGVIRQNVFHCHFQRGGKISQYIVEVILVLAIISIIATIAIPQVNKYLDKANKSKILGAISDLNNSS